MIEEEELKVIEAIKSGEACVYYSETSVINIEILNVYMLEEVRQGFFRLYIPGERTIIGYYKDIYKLPEKTKAFDRGILRSQVEIKQLESNLKNTKQKCAELEEEKKK